MSFAAPAGRQVYRIAVETPLQATPLLSKALGNEILLKREDLQASWALGKEACKRTHAHGCSVSLASRALGLGLRRAAALRWAPPLKQAHALNLPP